MKTLKYGSKSFLFIMIPLGIAIYLTIITYQRYILRSPAEVFPFFNWSLFSSPSKEMIKNYIKIDRVDGVALGPDHGLISVGDVGIRLQKAIGMALKICESTGFENCEKDVVKLLSPFVRWNSTYKKIDFYIYRCHIDPQKVATILKQGIDRFPKVVPCISEEKFGPWSIYK